MPAIAKTPAAFALLLLAGCASLDPRRVETTLPETLPAAKVTSYTRALADLGLMTEIYGAPAVRVQGLPLGDNTGTSSATGGEIPRDITEMMKSALNAIGGRVTFVPYDPDYIRSQAATGYSQFQNKSVPDVVLSGGITEFDRGLETRGRNADASGGAELRGLPDDFPSKAVDLRASLAQKEGLARITLDFNLLDMESMTGLPKMNVANSMEVRKALKEAELAVSLFGQTFGARGSVKKVQGRHAAVRLLVELSMVQLIGRHLRLPYWRLLGEEAQPDDFVLEQVADYFSLLEGPQALANVQEWLHLYGFGVKASGEWDEATRQALAKVYPDFDASSPKVDLQMFTHVYVNVPLTPEARRRWEASHG